MRKNHKRVSFSSFFISSINCELSNCCHGKKYGGAAYWDTEAFLIPFYLGIRNKNIARNLLLFRYNTLNRAIENAKKLGLKGALYPMVTFDGHECHNE